MMIEGRHHGDTLVLEILGALRWGNGRQPPSLRCAVEHGLTAGFRRMVLDLSDVSVMDSSALGDLAAALALATDAGCRVRLSGPKPPVLALLRAMRVEELAPVDADEGSALRALAGEKRESQGATTPPRPTPLRAVLAPLR